MEFKLPATRCLYKYQRRANQYGFERFVHTRPNIICNFSSGFNLPHNHSPNQNPPINVENKEAGQQSVENVVQQRTIGIVSVKNCQNFIAAGHNIYISYGHIALRCKTYSSDCGHHILRLYRILEVV